MTRASPRCWIRANNNGNDSKLSGAGVSRVQCHNLECEAVEEEAEGEEEGDEEGEGREVGVGGVALRLPVDWRDAHRGGSSSGMLARWVVGGLFFARDETGGRRSTERESRGYMVRGARGDARRSG